MIFSSPSTAVLGIGTALPEFPMTQDEAATLAQDLCARNDYERRLVKALYRKAGVKNRFTCIPHRLAYEWAAASATVAQGAAQGGIADVGGVADIEPAAHLGPSIYERMQIYREMAPPLALRSSAAALVEAQVTPAEITHLVTVSCTGFIAPGIDAALIDGLQLPRNTERIQVGFMGCHGAINGLRAATAIAAANPKNRVLLCAVELCSIHYTMEWDPLRAVGNAVFADGSAAMVLGTSSGTEQLRPAATGSYLIPNSADVMAWDIGNHGFEMLLSPRVPDVIGEHLRPWLESWLAEQGLTIGDVGSWAVHPGGPRILNATEAALGLDRSATAVSREVLAECGNMSSPTILFILQRLQARNLPRPYVALGFGPGLAAEAALFA